MTVMLTLLYHTNAYLEMVKDEIVHNYSLSPEERLFYLNLEIQTAEERIHDPLLWNDHKQNWQYRLNELKEMRRTLMWSENIDVSRQYMRSIILEMI